MCDGRQHTLYSWIQNSTTEIPAPEEIRLALMFIYIIVVSNTLLAVH